MRRQLLTCLSCPVLGNARRIQVVHNNVFGTYAFGPWLMLGMTFSCLTLLLLDADVLQHETQYINDT